LGVSRASLYYKQKLPVKDWDLKQKIEAVLHEYPSYGHRRLALFLKVNKKRVKRVMKSYGIKPYRRRPKKPRKPEDENKQPAPYQNLLLSLPFPDKPHTIWVMDFTYLWFHGVFLYLATVMDLFTRRIVGWYALDAHNAALTKGAFISALLTVNRGPEVSHSDQGSEYAAEEFIQLVEAVGTQISMSRKASPWENGYQESFYSQFKIDLGDPNRFETTGELVAAIAQTMRFYNTTRIHTALKMPPLAFAQQYEQRSNHQYFFTDKVSKEMGS
jgi:transposase InsO family protein